VTFARRLRVGFIALVLSHLAVWSSAAKVYADVRANESPAPVLAADGVVSHERISISLPVFITSLLATVGSTWYVASLYHEIKRKNALMSAKLAQLEREVHGDKGEDKWDGGGSDRKD